jgi:hypothetical protein
VRATQVLRPKQPRNFLATLGVSAVLLLVHAVASRLVPWSPKRGLGLAFGIVAALAFVFEMSYPARRPAARPLFTARNWIQVHVYLGVVALLAALIHAGLAWPKGGFGWWLFLLSAWTTLTGLLGVWLQKWIPPALAEGLQVEALYERIPALVDQLLGEADALMAETSDVLDRFYRTELRGRLATLAPSWGFLLDVRGGRERALEPLRRMVGFAEAEEKAKVEDLMSIYTEKMELDAQYSLQRILRQWLWLHVPAAGLLMGLLVIHVLTWVWY